MKMQERQGLAKLLTGMTHGRKTQDFFLDIF